MPVIWYSQDGLRPHTQRGPGTQVTFDEAQVLFGSTELRFVGIEAPNINPETPSEAVKNVVIEIEEGEGVTSMFPESGFYVAIGAKPLAIQNALTAHRALG